MFSIFLVEDIETSRDELHQLLSEVFPGTTIDPASTVTEGLEKIKAAAAEKWSYDIAILDFKLPVHTGETPKVDESICQAIKASMPTALVIHITSYSEDPQVVQHIRRYHTGKDGPRVEFTHKTAYWPEKLIAQIKTYYIEIQMDRLFGPKGAPLVRDRKMYGNIRDMTQPLATLTRDITGYWKALDESTKERIHSYFNVNDEQAPVRVSLRLPAARQFPGEEN